MRVYFTIAYILLMTCLSYGQKQVVVEKFTNAYCGACPGAAVILKDIVEDYPQVIWLSHHKPVSWIDNGLTNDESIGLWNDLDVLGTPMGIVDRALYNGELLLGSLKWEDAVKQELEKEQRCSIDLVDFTFDDETRELEFSIVTELISDLDSSDYNLNIIMVEDSVWGVEQHSYFNDLAGHPLEGLGDVLWGYPHRNVVRHIFDDKWGSQDIFNGATSAGTIVSKLYSYQIPLTSRLSTYHIVAFVSKQDETLTDLTIVDANKFRLADYGIVLNTDDDSIDSQVELSIAPNPISTQLNYKTSVLARQVLILDAVGRAIYQYVPSSVQDAIDVSVMESGQYSLLAIYESGIVREGFVIE